MKNIFDSLAADSKEKTKLIKGLRDKQFQFHSFLPPVIFRSQTQRIHHADNSRHTQNPIIIISSTKIQPNSQKINDTTLNLRAKYRQLIFSLQKTTKKQYLLIKLSTKQHFSIENLQSRNE